MVTEVEGEQTMFFYSCMADSERVQPPGNSKFEPLDYF